MTRRSLKSFSARSQTFLTATKVCGRLSCRNQSNMISFDSTWKIRELWHSNLLNRAINFSKVAGLKAKSSIAAKLFVRFFLRKDFATRSTREFMEKSMLSKLIFHSVQFTVQSFTELETKIFRKLMSLTMSICLSKFQHHRQFT